MKCESTELIYTSNTYFSLFKTLLERKSKCLFLRKLIMHTIYLIFIFIGFYHYSLFSKKYLSFYLTFFPKGKLVFLSRKIMAWIQIIYNEYRKISMIRLLYIYN